MIIIFHMKLISSINFNRVAKTSVVSFENGTRILKLHSHQEHEYSSHVRGLYANDSHVMHNIFPIFEK